MDILKFKRDQYDANNNNMQDGIKSQMSGLYNSKPKTRQSFEFRVPLKGLKTIWEGLYLSLLPGGWNDQSAQYIPLNSIVG